METYFGMNEKIVELLRVRDDAISLYAAERIEELENALRAAFPILCGIVIENNLEPDTNGYVVKEKVRRALS